MIFVSYAEEDWRMVSAIIRQSRKIAPRFRFFAARQPENVGAGSEWRAQLIRAMDSCEAAIIILSPVAASRPWVNFELGYITGRGTATVLCFGLQGYRPHDASLPSAPLQALRLPASIHDAAKTLVKVISGAVPEPPTKKQYVIQLGQRIYSLEQGWSQYNTAGNPQKIRRTSFGFAFGTAFDAGGFGFPASGDHLTGPWRYLFLRSNPAIETSVYFVFDMNNGDRIKLFLSTRQANVGWGSNPKNEFNVPLPSERPNDVVVNVASYVRLLGSQPHALRRILIRGPTELGAVGTADSLSQIPVKYRRRALKLALPA